MKVEEFDVEKLIIEDAESIEIDRDFKAQLKANLMKQNTANADNVIDFKDIRRPQKHIGSKHKESPHFKKYLAIASSFVIAGVFGVNIALNGMDNIIDKAANKAENEVMNTTTYVQGLGANSAEAVETNNETDEVIIEKDNIPEVQINEPEESVDGEENPEVDQGHVQETDNPVNDDQDNQPSEIGKGSEEGVAPNTEDGAEQPEESNEAAEKPDAEGNESIFNNGEGTVKNDNIDTALEDSENTVYESSNSKEEVQKIDISKQEVLVKHGNQNGINFYIGKMKSKEDGFKLNGKSIELLKQDGTEEVFQLDNGMVSGIKKLGDKLLVTSKNSGSKKYDLCTIDINSKEITELMKSAESIVFDKEFQNAVCEKAGEISIIDLENNKSVKKEGQYAAISPNGEYVSYVKHIEEISDDNKKIEYSVLVVYDVEKHKESYLTKPDYIQKNGEGDMGRYNYGKSLWGNAENSIYVMREDQKIITDNPEEKIEVYQVVIEE